MSSKTIYDKHGNRIGEDVITTDRDGLIHITHYDTAHNRVGRSYETTDYRGEVYMIHENAQGNRLARSTVQRDWWGDYYLKTEQTRYGWEHAEAERRKKETGKTRTISQEEDDGGESSPVIALLYGIIMIGVKLFIALLGYALVVAAAMPLVLWILMMSLNRTGNATLGWFWAFSIILITYFPYVGILLYRRWKKKINWKDFFLAVLRWAIIGPLAYRWLLRKKKEGKTEEYNPHRPYELPVWQCPTCKTGIFTSGRFCPNCGTAQPERPKPVTVLCPNCGKPLLPIPGKEKTGFCSECGRHYNIEQK